MEILYDCLPRPIDAAIGFSASMVGGNVEFFEEGQILPFDLVLTNVGGHFSEDVSSFICPVDGLYLFSVSVVTSYGTDAYAYVGIFTDSDFLAYVYAQNTGDNENYSAASSTIVVECFVGSRVWVETIGDSYFHAVFNMFSGSLLYRYDTQT